MSFAAAPRVTRVLCQVGTWLLLELPDRYFMSGWYLVAFRAVHQLTGILCQVGTWLLLELSDRYFMSGWYLVAFRAVWQDFMSGWYLVAFRAVHQLTGILCQVVTLLFWELWISWRVFYVRFVLGCFESCASADRYFMSGWYFVVLRAVHQLTGILCQVCTWLFWQPWISWRVFYVRLVLGCFESCASADRCFMLGWYLVAFRTVHQVTGILCHVGIWLFWELCVSWLVFYVRFIPFCF